MMGTKESVREFNTSLEEFQRKIHAIADRLEREEEIILSMTISAKLLITS